MTVFVLIKDERRQVMLRSAVEERNIRGVNAAMVVQCLNISWSTLHRSRLFAVGSYDQELSFEHLRGGALHILSLDGNCPVESFVDDLSDSDPI